ncbi:histidine kinase [Halostagnicola sp. A56]|uniref:bacterio-opsin activator domain-containing protein n=1 Tax=Halostagnicola sp. A56 TaxID=1495067 RepID=UPI0004A0BA3F|nr:bacterio-opsin activator domain-containing protein [Halostagnicola sp. A56]KDE60369.1 histidine kinase [Halostagnicola sp. A56]
MTVAEPDSPTLTVNQYDRLLEAAETYREALVVRLCGEVGVRPAELARLSSDDIDRVGTDPPRYLLRIPAEESESSADCEAHPGQTRTAYLPTEIQRELERYVRSNGIGDAERIFPVTPRRLQMLVADVADRAGERANDESLSSVSSSDLRRYFARSSLVDHEIDPRVVKMAGGWQSFEALESYLSEPTDEAIVEAFEIVEDRSESTQDSTTLGDDALVRSMLAETDRYALVRLDEAGYVERWNRSAASTFGYDASEIVGTHASIFYAEEDASGDAIARKLADATPESPHEDDTGFVCRDGSRFRATELVVPTADRAGGHEGYGLFVHDVSTYHEKLESERSRNDRLEGFDAVARRFRAVARGLLSASTHDEVETECCRAFVDGPAYRYAWIDRTARTGTRTNWRTSSAISPGEADRLRPDTWSDGAATADVHRGSDTGGLDGESASHSSGRSVRFDGETDDASGSSETPAAGSEGEPPAERTVVADVAGRVDEEYVEGTLARVCVSYGDTVYGTLSVVTERDDAFDRDELDWLETIGRQVGYAIAAVRRRNLLLSDTVVELEFVCRDEQSFFVDASAQLDCRFEIDSFVPVSESTQLYYVTLQDGSPATVFELAESDPGIGDCRLIETYEDGWRVEFIVEGSCPTLTLTEYGVTVLEAVVENGEATIAAECAGGTDLRTIVDGLRSVFPDSELAGKREVERTVQTAAEFRNGLADRLTDRQESALRAAYFGGYYDWPRESTAEEVADAMGVSSPTLHNHLRKGQHELLRTFFDAASE